MPAIPREDLQSLIDPQSSHCLTITMPCHTAGPEQQQNAIRFKNLLSEAESQAGDHKDALKDTFKALSGLTDDEEFWKHTDAGLAIFSDGTNTRMYQLPQTLAEHAEVADHYAITGVLPSLTEGQTFYILAVSRKHTRLLMASGSDVVQVPAGLPESLIKYQPEGEKAFGMHSFNTRRSDGQYGVPHGHPEEDKEPELRQFFNDIDQAVTAAIDSPDTPLVFAGVEELFPLYKDISEHRNLIGECVAGNPDETPNQELRAEAEKLACPHMDQLLQDHLLRLHNSMQTELATNDMPLIAAAAKQGAVENLFVNRDKFIDNPEGRTLRPETQTQLELLDAVVRQTLQSGGQVWPVPANEIGDAPCAAALRYAVAETIPS